MIPVGTGRFKPFTTVEKKKVGQKFVYLTTRQQTSFLRGRTYFFQQRWVLLFFFQRCFCFLFLCLRLFSFFVFWRFECTCLTFVCGRWKIAGNFFLVFVPLPLLKIWYCFDQRVEQIPVLTSTFKFSTIFSLVDGRFHFRHFPEYENKTVSYFFSTICYESILTGF